jgi:hypothetical protein
MMKINNNSMDDSLEWFRSDDRFAVLTPSDIEMHGGEGTHSLRVIRTAEWILETDNSEGFCAVLDPDDMTVATLDPDEGVVWQSLADFVDAN